MDSATSRFPDKKLKSGRLVDGLIRIENNVSEEMSLKVNIYYVIIDNKTKEDEEEEEEEKEQEEEEEKEEKVVHVRIKK